MHDMARILLVPFGLSKIAGEATIARHSGKKYQQLAS